MRLSTLWSILLAITAAISLGIALLLAQPAQGGFSRDERAALRAVTQAGLYAITADLQSGRANQAAAILGDSALRSAMDAFARSENTGTYDGLRRSLTRASEELLQQQTSSVTVALTKPSGKVLASNGAAADNLTEEIAQAWIANSEQHDVTTFSAPLVDYVQIVKIVPSRDRQFYLIAFEPLNLGADSLLRQVIGANYPAALIQDGKVVGDVIGNQPVAQELTSFVAKSSQALPLQGASEVLVLGSGLDARIGSVGRMPGLAGQGAHPMVLAVLSSTTAAAAHQGLSQRLQDVWAEGVVDPLDLFAAGIVLVVGIGGALLLFASEVHVPLKQLRTELSAIVSGVSSTVAEERYRGQWSDLVQLINGALKALRGRPLTQSYPAVDPNYEPLPTLKSLRIQRRTGRHSAVQSTISGSAPLTQEASSEGEIMEPTAPHPAAAPSVDEALQRCYEAFLLMRKDVGETSDPPAFPVFAEKLRVQREQLVQQTGAADVEFVPYLKDGRVAIRAKVIQ